MPDVSFKIHNLARGCRYIMKELGSDEYYKKCKVNQDGNTGVLPAQRRWKSTLNRRNRSIKEPKVMKHSKLFSWSRAHHMLETGEGDVRLKVKVGTKFV